MVYSCEMCSCSLINVCIAPVSFLPTGRASLIDCDTSNIVLYITKTFSGEMSIPSVLQYLRIHSSRKYSKIVLQWRI